ncbi:MAG TPA: lysozyme inhibitor LprI family protein [Gemmatimonadales bacterium]|nr:lysozyme inhibitor LprI family protein [Gemmatimonadales bacterium]
MLRATALALILLAGAAPVLSAQQALPDPCASDTTTAALRRCMSADLHAADSTMAVYYDMALRRAAAPSALRQAQAQWTRFRDADCRARAEEHQGGSLEPVVAMQCQADLARVRTHEIWSVYVRTTENPLPEPGVRE